jgi:hypothetical protein
MDSSLDRRRGIDVGEKFCGSRVKSFAMSRSVGSSSHQIQRPKVRMLLFDKVYFNHTLVAQVRLDFQGYVSCSFFRARAQAVSSRVSLTRRKCLPSGFDQIVPYIITLFPIKTI